MKLILVCLLTLSCGLGALGQDSLNVSTVAQMIRAWGEASDLVISGNRVYVATGITGVGIVDVIYPEDPVIAQTYRSHGSVHDVAAAGTLLYLADGFSGLRILDTTDPENPVELGGVDGGWNARGVAVAANLVFVAADTFGLRIIQAEDPSQPVEIGHCDLPGSARKLATQGDYAYVCCASEGVHIVDVSDPAAPMEIGWYDSPSYAYDVSLSGHHACVADFLGGLRVVDVAAPANPVEVGFYNSPGFARGLCIVGNTVYLAAGPGSLQDFWIVSIDNPSSPEVLCGIATTGTPEAVVTQDSVSYVAAGWYGLQNYNVADPEMVTVLSTCELRGYCVGVAVDGDFAYLASGDQGLAILNLTIAGHPEEIASLPIYEPSCVTKVGAFVYVGWSNGMRVVDVSDPYQPILVDNYQTIAAVQDIEVEGSYAFVADYDDGLRIVDVSDPANVVPIGWYHTSGVAYKLSVENGYVYLIEDYDVLRVVDVHNPSQPQEVASYTDDSGLWDAVAEGGFAYLAAALGSRNGVRVLDINDPSNPVAVGFWETTFFPSHLTFRDNYLYVTMSGGDGFRVLNVSDPTQPVQVGFYDTPGSLEQVSVVEGIAYAADTYYFGIYDISAALSASGPFIPHPSAFSLSVYPNPFNSVTTLQLDLPREVKVRLAVYDVLGREVTVLKNGVMNAGSHRVNVDANGWASGTYLVRMETALLNPPAGRGRQEQIQKVTLLK